MHDPYPLSLLNKQQKANDFRFHHIAINQQNVKTKLLQSPVRRQSCFQVSSPSP
jgi:hypothetical protein